VVVVVGVVLVVELAVVDVSVMDVVLVVLVVEVTVVLVSDVVVVVMVVVEVAVVVVEVMVMVEDVVVVVVKVVVVVGVVVAELVAVVLGVLVTLVDGQLSHRTGHFLGRSTRFPLEVAQSSGLKNMHSSGSFTPRQVPSGCGSGGAVEGVVRHGWLHRMGHRDCKSSPAAPSTSQSDARNSSHAAA
jgi:hypothetical protein